MEVVFKVCDVNGDGIFFCDEVERSLFDIFLEFFLIMVYMLILMYCIFVVFFFV